MPDPNNQEPTPIIGILTWDHREQPDLSTLSEMVGRFDRPSLHQMDTGADFLAIVVGPNGWSQADALDFYRNYFK